MPTVFFDGPYRFHFYSVDRNEPAHVHVERDDAECKFWLTPVRLAKVRDFGSVEVKRIERIVKARHKEIMDGWHEHFNR